MNAVAPSERVMMVLKGYEIPEDEAAAQYYNTCLIGGLLRKGATVNAVVRRNEKGLVDTRGNVRIDRIMRAGFMGYVDALKHARATRPSVIHVQHEIFMYGGILAAISFPLFVYRLRAKAPVVVTLHHVVRMEDVSPDFLEAHNTWLPLSVIKPVLRSIYTLLRVSRARFIVHHQRFADVLVKEYGFDERRVDVVPHGYFERPKNTRERAVQDLHRGTFCFFGHIDPRKDIDFLIDEFARFASKNPGCTLVIAGNDHPRLHARPEYQTYLSNLKEKASRSPSVVWRGEVPNQQLPDFLESVDCVVLPYRQVHGASSVLAYAAGYRRLMVVSKELLPFYPQAAASFDRTPGALESALSGLVLLDAPAIGDLLQKNDDAIQGMDWDSVARKTLLAYGRAQAGA